MKIVKFGGSSVSTPERVRGVISIVKERAGQPPQLAVVVSAFGGVTDELIAIGQHALAGRFLEPFALLKERHFAAARELVPQSSLPEVHRHLVEEFKSLEEAYQGVMLVKELSKHTLDFIMSFGERLSAFIISAAMNEALPAVYLDARQIVKTDKNHGAARVNFEESNRLIRKWFAENRTVPVITGFIGSTDEGDTTTLGRGGSDYTASIFGAALQAEAIEIWTDVDGVMTADPRKVRQAFPIPQMSYNEALEMSHFGAKVIHPPTITPALKRHIPIWIKNTFNPKAKGSLITANHEGKAYMICGLTSIDRVALLRLEGSGMVGVSGTSMRLFGALGKKEINIILISQGSSEHTICFAVVPQAAEAAKAAIDEEFALERHAGLIEPVIVEDGLSVIAAVGENMRHTPGIAGRLFGALGKNGVNVVAMVQGSSEYNITIVVKADDESKALNVIHDEFFLSQTSTAHLFIVGTGLIGSTLLAQMHRHIPQLRKENALDIKVVGLASSKSMAFDPLGIDLANWKDLLDRSGEKMVPNAFVKIMKEMNLSNSVFVDCTASEEVAEEYPSILGANISIVTPNKKANSGPYERYLMLKTLSKGKGVKFLYETNVGAGLPIISTVIDLLRSGDKIVKIEAILSGTLSYLFNTFQAGKSFSQSLKEAQEKGFTEPDPREDLNGNDVMRKLLILARESGSPLEMSDIRMEPLLPKQCFDAGSVQKFYERLQDYDAEFERKKASAASEGKALRYIATFSEGKAVVELKAVDAAHPFYHLSGSDNIISIYTERYRDTPLVIKGQGAGAEVTAGEVFADIVRITAHI